MSKTKIAVLLVAIAVVVGFAVVWATGKDIHDRRILATIAANDKAAQILEEEAAKPVEKRDLVRMEEARIEWLNAFKTNMSDHYAPDEILGGKNPAFDAAFARHQTESVRARKRIDKAFLDINPEYAKQMEQREEQVKQWLRTK